MEVVAGWIEEKGRVLLGLRPEGYWEFPGGRKEKGENLKTALQREIREELDLEVEIGEIMGIAEKENAILYLFKCRIKKGFPKPIFHQEIKWVEIKSLKNFPLGEWDRELLKKIDIIPL